MVVLHFKNSFVKILQCILSKKVKTIYKLISIKGLRVHILSIFYLTSTEVFISIFFVYNVFGKYKFYLTSSFLHIELLLKYIKLYFKGVCLFVCLFQIIFKLIGTIQDFHNTLILLYIKYLICVII